MNHRHCCTIFRMLFIAFPPDISIQDAADLALMHAKAECCRVEFDFNGHRCWAMPGDEEEWILERWANR